MDRIELKRACLAELDAVAVEHPAGHQGKLAARYVLLAPSRKNFEMMFEKAPGTKANLWVLLEAGSGLLDAGIPYRLSPAAGTYATKDSNGKPMYGRHSALRPMTQLANADLICFSVERPGQMSILLEHLRSL